MKVLIVTPPSPYGDTGNAVTANRWRRILSELRHDVSVAQAYGDENVDLVVILHARRSHTSLARFRATHPNRPAILALTGTDLYGELGTHAEVRQSLELASRVVTLQDKGLEAVPDALRAKARVIYQSASGPPVEPAKSADVFQLCVLAHLREVKDPLRCAYAVRRLPATSRVRVLHAGRALTPSLGEQARAESASNPRYVWLGPLPHDAAQDMLARSHLMALTSRMEGGANVIAEAAVARVPIVASRIPGTLGMLGEDYPGYFEVGETAGLAELIHRAETDTSYYRALTAATARVGDRFSPRRERQAWRELLDELAR